MADQLSVLESVKNAQNEILAVLDQQKQVMASQLALSQALRESAAGGTDIDQLADKVFEINDALKATGEQSQSAMERMAANSDKAKKSIGGAGSAMGAIRENLAKIGASAPVARMKGFTDGLKKGLTPLINIGISVFGIFKQIAKSAFNIGVAIISIPLRIFSNLIKLSNDMAKAFKHIAEAFEKFRGQFGDLNNEIGTSMNSALDGAMAMGQHGIGFYSIFTDAAGAISFFGDMFGAMGPLVDTFAGEIADMGEKFVIVTKGLGLTGEHMKGLASLAKSSGKSLEETLDGIAAQATIMEEHFGVSSKLIGQDMAKMAGDVSHFGNMSAEAMGAAAMRVRSLGLEVGVLGKLVDKFLNFEDAAKNASMLSQSFGVNLDALQLMNGAAEGGADTLDQLRNAMFSAGKDASKMSTAELRLLAQTSGLSEEEARLAFSMENRGKSMEDIRKIAKKSDPQERMADTMERLAGNIERIIRVFSYDSFFGAFLQGFERGIKLSTPFVEMLSNLHQALDLVMYAGMAVGEAFINTFPGIMDMITAFNAMFNPDEYAKIAETLKSAFKDLFAGLSVDGMDVDKLLATFWETLAGVMGEDTNGDSIATGFLVKFKDGFLKFLGGISGIITGSIPLIQKKLIVGMDAIVDILTNGFDDSIKQGASDLKGGAKDAISKLFGPIWQALVTATEDPVFRASLAGFRDTLIEKLIAGIIWVAKGLASPKVIAALAVGLGGIFGVQVLASMIGSLLLQGSAYLIASIATWLTGGVAAGAATAAGSTAVVTGGGGFGAAIMTAITAVAAGPVGWAGIVVAMIAALALALGGFSMMKMIQGSDEGDGSWGAYFGEKFESMKTAFWAVFESVGDIISDLWAGEGLDSGKVNKLGQDFGTMIWDGFILSMSALITGLGVAILLIIEWGIKLPLLVQEWTYKMAGAVSTFVEGLLENIPIFGYFLGSIAGVFASTFNFIGGIFSAFGDMFTYTWAVLSGDISMEDWAVGLTATFSSLFRDLQRMVLSFMKMLGASFGMNMIPGFEKGMQAMEDSLDAKDKTAEAAAKKREDLKKKKELAAKPKNKTTTASPSKPVGTSAETAAITDALADSVDIEAAIKADPNSIIGGVKNKQLLIEHKALNLTLNLTITMDSDKVAEAVLATKLVMPKGG